jgi:hypothetical protein
MRKSPLSIDRRIARTRLALRDALLELLAVKCWDDIGIHEICTHANVGRSTFYIHFQGKDELLLESMNDLKSFLISNPPSSRKGGFHLLHGLLDHIAEQRTVFKALIGRRGGQSVISRFKELTRQLIELEFKQRGMSAAKNQWLTHYLTGGMVDLMSWWVDSKSVSIEELKQKLDVLISKAMQVD